ncbi:Ribonuclease H superfamily [Sesbania bispinosa]|nr:Ribonuclease H superfamily [Sesbania bispinosa]
MVESDSLQAINLLNDGCSDSHPAQGLISRIHHAERQLASISWVHTFRDANKLADCFAKKGLEQDVVFRVYDWVPSFPLIYYITDSSGR